jgi:hypothetical protein
LLKRLSGDLIALFGRGFSERNLEQMRLFYLSWPSEKISQTSSAESTAAGKLQTASGQSPDLSTLAQAFPLPWPA